MGMLDFVPRKEFKPKRREGDTPVVCDKCGETFMGQSWMNKQKSRMISCPDCWKKTEAPKDYDDIF